MIPESWLLRATRRVKNCLDELVAIFPHLAKALKLVREENKRERLRREEERKQEEEEQQRQEEYDRKAKVVADGMNATLFATLRLLSKTGSISRRPKTATNGKS